MATIARVTLTPVGGSYNSTSAGESVTFAAVGGGGDMVLIGSGRGTVIRFKTSGTPSTITITNALTNAWSGVLTPHITITMAATEEKEVFLYNDGSGRFDQGGANAGYVSITYSPTTGVTLCAKTIP